MRPARRFPSLATDGHNPQETGQRPPNILFCIADDWSWPHASVAGDKVVKTPTFDRVVREGVLFQNAFVTAPSCTPSRGSIVTGQWHWRLEEGGNLWSTLPAKFAVYPDLLEKAGYHVGVTRKGWGPGQPQPGGRTRNPAGPAYKDFNAFLAARPEGKPFCFWFGSNDPHRPYEWQSGVKSGMRPQDVKVPACLPDNETRAPGPLRLLFRSAALRPGSRRDPGCARSERRVGEHAGRDDRRQRPALPPVQEQSL